MIEFTKSLMSLGGRKFFVVIGAGIATTALCAAGKITDQVYAVVICCIITVFVGGNVTQAIKGKESAVPAE